MKKSILARTALMVYAAVTLNVAFTGLSEAGKKQKPQCVVIRTDPKAELPPRNAGIPSGVPVNAAVTFQGFQCVPRDSGSANCAFFYDERQQLKCKAIGVSL